MVVQIISEQDGMHLWSEKYDRPLTGIFAVQDELGADRLGVTCLFAGFPDHPAVLTSSFAPASLAMAGRREQALQRLPADPKHASELSKVTCTRLPLGDLDEDPRVQAIARQMQARIAAQKAELDRMRKSGMDAAAARREYVARLPVDPD